jgi:hypothetical protein
MKKQATLIYKSWRRNCSREKGGFEGCLFCLNSDKAISCEEYPAQFGYIHSWKSPN